MCISGEVRILRGEGKILSSFLFFLGGGGQGKKGGRGHISPHLMFHFPTAAREEELDIRNGMGAERRKEKDHTFAGKFHTIRIGEMQALPPPHD